MIAPKKHILIPRGVRLDASSVCQLKCPACPTASGATGEKLGLGYLKIEDFKRFIRRNPHVSYIELSNWGEVFLNKDLPKILAYAYRHNVCMNIGNGANMNFVTQECAEALVKYKLRHITCSIDGASQETYHQYRINGDFNSVIANIKMINRIKAKYRSPYPRLKWQFVAFGHNEHEIEKARLMAESLNMDFYLKLSWQDLYELPDFSPVKNKERIRQESGTGASSRKEYLEKFGEDYVEHTCCWDMWNTPQINYDGRILGCPINYWGDYGNAFDRRLKDVLNDEPIAYARSMLMGKRSAREGIPCSTCKIYKRVRDQHSWVTDEDVRPVYRPTRRYIMMENKILGEKGTKQLGAFVKSLKIAIAQMTLAVTHGRLTEIFTNLDGKNLPNQGYPLTIPLWDQQNKPWKPHFLFRGHTRGIRDFSCHASSLVLNHSPHAPHTHKEEEILLMLDGEAELNLPEYQNNGHQGRLPLKKGEFVYYPSFFPHTLTTISKTPANYLMFKWYSPRLKQHGDCLGFGKFTIAKSFEQIKGKDGFAARTIFEGPTQCQSRIQAHASTLCPGAGYKPHADRYAVAIIVLEGVIETLGKHFSPHSVIFHPAGKLHGLSNPGDVPAKYIVFEFQK